MHVETPRDRGTGVLDAEDKCCWEAESVTWGQIAVDRSSGCTNGDGGVVSLDLVFALDRIFHLQFM